MAVECVPSYASAMPKKAKPHKRRTGEPVFAYDDNYLRSWRTYRKLSTEALAEKAGMSPGNISLLERNLQGYSREGLKKLSDALECRPGDILNTDPYRDGLLLDALRLADDRERQQLAEIAKIITMRHQ